MSIKKYLAKKLEVEKTPSPPSTTSHRPRSPFIAEARYINRLFTLVKSDYSGCKRAMFSERSSAFTTFIKLAERYKDVDFGDFIKAHFEFYGELTFPNHLLSKFSYGLYLYYQTVKYAPEFKLNHHQQLRQEIDLLKHMSKRWEMSPSEVFKKATQLFPNLWRSQCEGGKELTRSLVDSR